MTLITRQGKGYRLTIPELDNNLEYLETLGIKEITQEDNRVILERPNGSISEIIVDNNLPVVLKSTFGDEETGFITYKGTLKYDFESPVNIIPLKYNIDKDTLSDIDTEWGKTYYFSGRVLRCIGNDCSDSLVYGYLESNINYDPGATFSIGTGFNNTVNTIAIQSDGKILVGGWFSSYNGTTRNRIIRLNSDGSIDDTFNIGTGFNSDVVAITIQSDGKILVGGFFTSYNGTTSNRIIRLNSDGSIDNTFSIGTGFNDGVQVIQLQSDGKILVGGRFTSYNGTTINRIIRLNSDGSIDNTFNIGTGFNNVFLTIKIQSDGKILLGGTFTLYDGTTRNRIIRLNSDGSIDNTFNIGTGFNSFVNSIQIQSDGKILVGGGFTSYNGTTSNLIIRLNSDGSIDDTFNIGTGFNDFVNTLTTQSDGKILVGGQFTSYNGTTSNRIIRLNSDGSRDDTFSIGTGFNNTVVIIQLQSDGKILVGGQFTTYNGITSNRITLLSTNGLIQILVPFNQKYNKTTTPSNFILDEINGTLSVVNTDINTDSGILEFNIIQTNIKK